MALLKRLGWFLVGLSIGIVFLTFFIKKKTEGTDLIFCYLPNCRTLKDIRSKTISYSDEVKALLQEQQLDTTEINGLLLDGDVDFGRSDTKSTPCKTYFIEGEIKKKEALLEVKNCETTATVESVTF